MPELKVNQIVDKNNTGSPELTFGITIPSGKTISGSGGMMVNGSLTGTFSGDGSNLTSLITSPKSYAVKLILDPLPFRS